MAIYHASTKPIARSAGRSAVAAAAYRAGVELVDVRTGLVHDYTRKGGVEHTEILAPDGLGAERNGLWDAAELAEKRKDARTAREWIVALPSELTAGQRTDLARDFGQCLVERYGVAVDFAIHAPDREGDNRNHHAHILTTTRQVSRGPDGVLVFGDKAHIELSDRALRAIRDATIAGPTRPGDRYGAADEVQAVRELWERVANAALERAGVRARIDARSLEAQGIDREASQHLGPVASEMERRGKASDRGDGNRQVSDHNMERARLSAEIIDLQAARERRARREAARREFEDSHGGQPDTLSVTRAVAALVGTQAQRARQATQERWTERQRRVTRREREARRERLVALAEALAKDPSCRLPLRQAYLDAGYRLQQQGDKGVFVYPHDDLQAERKAVSNAWQSWDQRKQGLKRDRVTEQETRPGIRHPDKPLWQAERERILTQAYNADVAEKMGRWYRVESGPDGITLSNREATIIDYGDRITSRDGNGREIEAMVDLARAKGWERVSLTGTAEFQERAARAFVEAGIGLTDARLEQTARDAIEADRRKAAREHAAKAREAALIEQQERETRPGIRHADRSQWAADRSLVLSLQYDNQHTERAEQRGFYCRWMEDEQGLLYERRKDGVTFIDQGPVIVAPHGAGHPERDAIALVLYAQGARKWDSIEITGDETFRLRAAIAAVEEGLTVTDSELTKRAEAVIERRERLVVLADALAKDSACGLSIRQAYLDAGYQRQQQGDKWVFVYPHDDLLAERKAVFTARQAWDQRKQEQKEKVPRAQISAYGAEYGRRDDWKGSFTGAVIAVDEGHVYVGSKGGSVAPHFVAIPKERFKTQPSVGLYATFTQGDAQRPAGWSKVLGKMNGQGRLVRDQGKGQGIGD
ncbi:MobQ family relaxase [Acidithiobacillus acidisediminis]|uniref:MobQ family relaxase n=1 Tax=Acidithiobacillus acidisediminis TaxID=2937799 RepID=UPI00200E6121|nr:MobQ family relaxase [Acidithiobacillus sp. S30A2]